MDRSINTALADERRAGLWNAHWTLLVRDFEGTPIPDALIVDAVLEPIDKIVWQVMDVHARGAVDATTLPRYRELARQVNVTTRGTVSRAMAMLRCTRWLTVCERFWGHRTRRRGNVYVLHAVPFPLADTMFLDPGYLEFLDRATRYDRKRVRLVAQQVLGDIRNPPQSVPDDPARGLGR